MQADELNRFLAVAEEAADIARQQFVEGLGSAPALYKSSNDFATEVDLQIETTLRKHLTESTGIPVLGEEKGGQKLSDALWVVDPIDGTANFSSGNPNCAVLISLLEHHLQPHADPQHRPTASQPLPDQAWTGDALQPAHACVECPDPRHDQAVCLHRDHGVARDHHVRPDMLERALRRAEISCTVIQKGHHIAHEWEV